MTKPIPALTPLVIELAASAATSRTPPVVVATGDLGSRSHLPPSDRAVAVHPPCGVRLGFGERIVGLGATDPFLVVPGGAWAGATLGTDLAIASPQLANQTIRGQEVFLALGSNEPVRLTNGVELEVGTL